MVLEGRPISSPNYSLPHLPSSAPAPTPCQRTVLTSARAACCPHLRARRRPRHLLPPPTASALACTHTRPCLRARRRSRSCRLRARLRPPRLTALPPHSAGKSLLTGAGTAVETSPASCDSARSRPCTTAAACRTANIAGEGTAARWARASAAGNWRIVEGGG